MILGYFRQTAMSASGEAQFSRVCDRAGAREARTIIRDQLLQVAHHHGVSISEHCPLHPNHDRLRLHESHKQMTTQNQWKCALCGKMFRSEHYIDLHLERKHHHTLPQNATMVSADEIRKSVVGRHATRGLPSLHTLAFTHAARLPAATYCTLLTRALLLSRTHAHALLLLTLLLLSVSRSALATFATFCAVQAGPIRCFIR